MKARLVVVSVLVAACLLLGAGIALAQEPAEAPVEEPVLVELEGAELEGAELSAAVGTAFTYQGRLLVDGRPANGTYDFKFNLTGATSGMVLILATDTVEDVVVTDGTFSVPLDFGQGRFAGAARYVYLSVRAAGGTTWTSLTPHQELRPVPYAMGLAWPVTGTVSSTVPLLTLRNSGYGNAFSASSATGTAIAAETGTDGGGYILGLVPAAVFGNAPGDGFGVEGRTINGTGVVGEVSTTTGTGSLFRGRVWTDEGLFGSYETMFRVNTAGRGYFDGGTQVGGADLAEFIDASGALEPGDVVEIDPMNEGQFRLATTANSALVAGVISTEPGASLGAQGSADEEDTRPQLAMAGTVPVKVCDENGAIQPGDLLVASSVAGRAMAAPADPAAGTVIGKALGSLESGDGVIQMLVMLR